MKLCIRYAKMPRKDFIKAFPGNETNLKWTGKLIKVERPTGLSGVVNQEVEIVRAQRKLAQVEQDSGLTILRLKISTAVSPLVKPWRVAPRKKWLKLTCVW